MLSRRVTNVWRPDRRAGTGAYTHSMASNYNLVGRPPVVAVLDGATRLLVRRETDSDLLRRDIGV